MTREVAESHYQRACAQGRRGRRGRLRTICHDQYALESCVFVLHAWPVVPDFRKISIGEHTQKILLIDLFFFFWNSFRFAAKLSENRGVLLIPPPFHTPTAPSTVDDLQQRCTRVTIGELPLTPHYRPGSPVDTRVHSWHCAFQGF